MWKDTRSYSKRRNGGMNGLKDYKAIVEDGSNLVSPCFVMSVVYSI